MKDDFPQIVEYIHEGEQDHALRLFNDALEYAQEMGFQDGVDEQMFRFNDIASDEIKSGYFDDEVVDRAKEIGMDFKNKEDQMFSENLQMIHSVIHPLGPYGYEYCAKCIK